MTNEQAGVTVSLVIAALIVSAVMLYIEEHTEF